MGTDKKSQIKSESNCIRLDKLLSDAGYGTRSEVKKLIKSGRVKVGGITALKSDIKVETSEEITIGGARVAYQEMIYIMLNKPAFVVSATEDKKQRTVIDLVDKRFRKNLFPVGRLDKDTEGLLLLTNDGVLAHKLLSPKKHVDKEYFALIDQAVGDDDITAFMQGMDIGDEKPTLPAKLERVEESILADSEHASFGVKITIQEGRYHQIKRMFEAVGKEVVYLKRLRMGSLVLDETLNPGDYRLLSEDEIKQLVY